MKTSVSNLFKKPLRHLIDIIEPDEPVEPLEKIGENLTPNMRALRLVMTLAEELLSMGVSASDVVHMCLGITNTYCKRRVHIDISYTQITVSQDRGIDREPLTLIRTISPDDANYQQIQALQALALKIRDTAMPLDEAEKKIDEITTKPKQHSIWITSLAGGGVSAGVAVLYDGAPLMIVASFLMGLAVTGILRWLSRLGVATFYSQVAVAMIVMLATIAITQLNDILDLAINPTLMAIGGIVLLVAGLMIVGAFQDAMDEFYVTANARLLKVAMATGGIVVGVLAGLYVATRLGVNFPATPDRLTLADTQTQYIGALIIATAFSLRNHARLLGAIVAGAVGMLGWWISRLAMSWDFSVVISSGIAAGIIGLMATFVSRFWRVPSIAIIAAGIVPLVPGLSLYNGLMGVVDSPPIDPGFMSALSTLMHAIAIGFAVAAGASLGNIIGRPLRRRVIALYNHLPHRRLSRTRGRKYKS